MSSNPWLRISLALAALVFAATACDTTPEWPASTEWTRFEHATPGYAVDIPAACKVEERGGSVIFRYKGDPILCINYVTSEEGRRRGLWSGKDAVGDIELAGQAGKKYVYQHGDGPMWMNVISYVIPYRGHELGVEFRMRGDEIGEVQRHIVESFALPQSP